MNVILAGYFAFIGAFALAATVDPVLVQMFGLAVSSACSLGANFSPFWYTVAEWLQYCWRVVLLGTGDRGRGTEYLNGCCDRW